jgi:hypothetical protein
LARRSGGGCGAIYCCVVAAESGFGLDLVRRCQYPVGRRARLAGAPRRERKREHNTFSVE